MIRTQTIFTTDGRELTASFDVPFNPNRTGMGTMELTEVLYLDRDALCFLSTDTIRDIEGKIAESWEDDRWKTTEERMEDYHG